MNEQTFKIWVIKFCVKVIYPKFNPYLFLVFLTIKHRIHQKKIKRNIMDLYEVKSISSSLQSSLLQEKIKNKKEILEHKCLIISQKQFLLLSSENLFYVDNGVLWLCIKLPREEKDKFRAKEKSSLKTSLQFLTSKIHKKLWTSDDCSSMDNIRIVPIVGSSLVEQNIALTTENEFYNLVSCFTSVTDDWKSIHVSFHPVPDVEYAPQIAATAEISLIVNSYDLSNEFIKEILTNHFEKLRLMSIGDVFYIELTPEVTDFYYYKYFDLVLSTGRLYFKCNKITNQNGDNDVQTKNNVIQSYFIVKGVTHLTLGNNIHILKPKDIYLENCDIKPQLSQTYSCPTGLEEKFNQIDEAIRLFLSSDLNELSLSMTTPIIPMMLLTGPLGSGKHLLIKILAKRNGLNHLQIDCNSLQSSTAKQTESKISSTIQKAKATAPVIVSLDNFEVFAVDPENNEDCRVMEYFTNSLLDLYQNYTKHPIIFIAITEKQDLKPNIARMFLEKFHIPKLNVQQRKNMLLWFFAAMGLNIGSGDTKRDNVISLLDDNLESKLSKESIEVLERLAAKTETFRYGDIDTLMHFALRESYLKQHNSHNQLDTDPDLLTVSEEDFDSALETMRKLQSQHLDAPKIPKVYWEDIGGLHKLKKELLKTIEFPIKYPHLFKNSTLKRSGILLYGPPGCGKTLVAKAVSTELRVSFLSVKGPELLNMYIGQSEENVRRVFESARASSPCIVFLDELDSLAPARGSSGDSGGAGDRVVSQLLAELDAVSPDVDTSMVFVMGATNRPDLLEQSLLRPGRLDKLIYVGPYCGDEEKTSVLNALCRSYKLDSSVELQAVGRRLPERCTGADLLQVTSSARSDALRNIVSRLKEGTIKESELSSDSVVLTAADFEYGISSFRPSVTDEEMAYYESLQSQNM